MNSNTLYDIDILEEDGAQVKIHYKGYHHTFDEWRPKDQVVLKKPEIAPVDFHPITELACQTKKRLLPSRHEDPAVRIQVPGSEEAFEELASTGQKKGSKYSISAFSDLTPILGDKWYLRIANRNGDFSHVILSTVEYYLAKPHTLTEYEALLSEDGTITFEPVYIEQCYSIVLYEVMATKINFYHFCKHFTLCLSIYLY